MVDFGTGQGRSDDETGGVAALRRGFQLSENADLDRKMPFVDGHLAPFSKGQHHIGPENQQGAHVLGAVVRFRQQEAAVDG